MLVVCEHGYLVHLASILQYSEMSRKKAPSGTPGGSDALKGLSAEMQDCHGILKFFQGKPEASAFLEPVDWKGFNLPDYPEIIKTPMDLGTVEVRLQGVCAHLL